VPRAIFIPRITVHDARQTLIVLCATSRPCFRSSTERQSEICSNVIVFGSTSPHMSRIRNQAGHQTFVRVIGVPLALGSWWGLVVPLVGLFITPRRLFDEEHMLEQGLPGYKEYEQKVRYRIVPYLW
jgi:hypothetical protein